MYTGILITGATGSAKTSAAQYPFTAQLIHLHADDPARKMGGLIIDAKGNYADFVREQCALAGRLADYYEVSLTSGVRWNIIGRPDLNAAALGGHIADMIENVQGTSLADPFWHQEAKDLASQVIRVLRLAEGREPTMATLYRAATSYEAFEDYVKLAEKRVNTAEQQDELASIKFWLEAKAAKLDAKLRASIAAGLNGVCSLFDDPKIREVFAPDPLWENFKGFDRLIEEGQIVALRVPKSQLKTVSTIVGTMTKLNFFDAVLNRLARAEHGFGDVGRGVFFVADEYDGYTTQPGDGDFFSKCREAKCCAVIATQTYESFVAKLKNEHVAAQLIANLRTKIWLCAEDNYTARQAADLCGEIERKKVSRSRNETRAALGVLVPRRRRDRRRPGLGGGGHHDQPSARASLHAAGLHQPQGQPGDREGLRRRARPRALGRLPQAHAREPGGVLVRHDRPRRGGAGRRTPASPVQAAARLLARPDDSAAMPVAPACGSCASGCGEPTVADPTAHPRRQARRPRMAPTALTLERRPVEPGPESFAVHAPEPPTRSPSPRGSPPPAPSSRPRRCRGRSRSCAP